MGQSTLPITRSDNGLPVLVAAALALVLLTIASCGFVEHAQRWNFVAASIAHGAVYFAAVLTILRHPGCVRTLWGILIVAVVLRVIAMSAPPYLSTDVFRYIWDGRLGWEGISPYLYPPADERLISLRDAGVFPHINQKEQALTIYPPVAQLVFMAGVAIQDGIGGMKAIMMTFEAATVIALIGWLRAEGLPASRVLIYAWHPLPIWEFASQAHLDAAATAFLALGIWAAVQRRQGLTGVLFGFAAMVKYFPLVLLPALWLRWNWKLPIALFLTIGLLYAPYIGDAGTGVLGFLSKHLGNEGYKAGWGFHVIWYLHDFGVAEPPVWIYLGIALATIIALSAWAVFLRGRSEFRPERLVLLGAAFVFLTSPHYPWYFGFLCALAVRIPHPALLTMTIMSVVLYLNRIDGHSWSELYALAYVLPLVVWGAWEIAIGRSRALARVNNNWMRLDLMETKL